MRKNIRAAILAEAGAAQAILEKSIAEQRDLTDVERDTIEAHLSKATDIEKQYKAEEEIKAKMAALTANLGPDPDPAPAPAGDVRRVDERQAAKSIGDRFVNSPEFKALMSAAPNGLYGEKARVQSAPMPVDGVKALFFSGDRTQSAGVLMQNDYRGLLDPFYQRPLVFRQLVSSGSTTSDTIEYVREVATTNNAATVPEARSAAVIDGTTVTNAIGGLKPQSTFAFARDSTTIKTIAHWIPATKRSLSDVGMIRSMIDNFLRYGLEEELEDQMINGSGSGENFLGLANTPGVLTQAAPGAGQDNMDILRIARRKVQIAGRARPTAYLMNPVDWESIELTRNANGDFYAGGPFSMASPHIWGLPIVESEAVPVGTSWVAAWNFAVLFDREQASVQATDAHADFFVRNLVAILAEMRAGFAVMRPPAFCKISLA